MFLSFDKNKSLIEQFFLNFSHFPIIVRDDGKLPRTICPGCNIQLEATVQFFELLINGQKKIQEMWKQQVECEQKTERARFKQKNINIALENSNLINEEDENSGTESSEQQIIINVMPDGSMYASEHNLSLQMEGLDKPKRKRGRPPKGILEDTLKEVNKCEGIEEVSQEEEEKHYEEEFDGDGRRRRKRKVPQRYMETVQGKELEKIFKDEGVLDEDEIHVKYEPIENQNVSNVESSNSDTEIIGHLETVEGKNLGELVVINKNKAHSKSNIQKSKIKRKHKFTCSYCGKGFLQRSKYIIHRSLHKSEKYECAHCQNQFVNKEDLDIHQRTVGHAGEKLIELNDVDYDKAKPQESNKELIDSVKPSATVTATLTAISNTADSLTTIKDNELQHNETENQESYNKKEESSKNFKSKDASKSFKCDKCNKHFQSKDNLETHIKVVHQGEKPFICDICNKAFAYQSSLKGHKEIVHQNNQTDKGFPCDVCGKVLNHPSSIMYHKLTEHNNGRRFVCNKCGKSFKHKQLLQRHQLVHSEDRPYPCKSCNASFKTKANLLNHQSTHTGEKKHFCELCDHKFAHKTSLTLHYRTHTGQKPYKCEVCSKSFSQNGNLQEHMRIHTGEKPYCCDHCGRKFTTSSQFKLHVKRHTGERPWKCEFCAKSFLHKDTWKCHVRRHTGERPFQCAYCNRGFTEQWALKKHLRLHTGEKPYSCDICGKAFADCSNLTKHKKVHKSQQVTDSGSSEGPTIREVWQILPNSEEENVNSLNNMTQVLTTDDISQNGMSRIIYVAYQDPDHSNESANLQFNKESMVADQESNLNVTEDNENSINMGLTPEPDLHLQITDEEGNAIPLSIHDAQRLLSEQQFVNQLNEGQTIRVQGLPSSLEMNPDVEITSIKENSISKNSSASTVQTDAEAIVKVLEDEDTDATTAAAINQMNAEDRIELANGQQAIEFITPDGQKIRLVTTLNIDPMQLASQYLTIV